MKPLLRLVCLATLLYVSSLQAQTILSAPSPYVPAGGDFDLVLVATNATTATLRFDIELPMHVRAESATAVATLEVATDDLRTDTEVSRVELAPGAFKSVRVRGRLPAEFNGKVDVQLLGVESNPVVLIAAEGAPQPQQPASPAHSDAAWLALKPPPLAVSVYEPVYFLVGGDGGLNAKFQLSFRYRLFDNQGQLAEKLPWIDDLYLAYSQTSLWDLSDLSKPFRDSSYRPRFFYANYDLTHSRDGLWHFGVEGGFAHESNGKDGTSSRSMNSFYVKPMATLGDPEGWRVFIAPAFYRYIEKSENRDIADYRGYVDWLFGIGSKGGWNFWATLRKGTRSTYGSAELNLSYPLARFSGGDLSGWLLLQYFNGYGESLLDYNRREVSQWRLGLSVAL